MDDCHSTAQSPFQDITCFSQASEDVVRVLKIVCVVCSLFLKYRMCVKSLGLGNTLPKCVFPKRVHQHWHPRLIKRKHLGSSKGFSSTCVFLCFQGYDEHIQILNKVTVTRKFSSAVLSLASGFFQLIFELLLNYMQRWSLFLFYIYMCVLILKCRLLFLQTDISLTETTLLFF